MRVSRYLLAVLIPALGGTSTIASVVHAQAGPRAASFWFSASAGIASTRLTCDICATQRDVGLALTAAVGTYARPQVRLGIEASRWRFQDPSGVEERWLAFGLVTQVMPDAARGLFLHGGAGWTGYRAGEFSYDAPRLSVGIGWELEANERWFVGSLLSIDAASFGALKNDGATVARDVGLSAIRLSVQLQRR